MENVKELLKKEQQAKDILANIGREKEELAINKLAELKEILAALDCSHLLEAKTIERIVEKAIIKKGKVVEVVKENNPVNITINKGKIVQGPVQVVQDMTEIEKHLDTITEQGKEIEKLKKTIATMQRNAAVKEEQGSDNLNILRQAITSKDKYIVELESKLADKAYQAANDGYVVDGAEVSLAVVNELSDEIERLREKLAEKEAAEITETTNVFNEEDYMAFLASQEESIMSEINAYEQIIEEPKKEIVEVKEENKDTDKPQFVTVSNAKVGKNPNAKLYQTEKCYLIASPTTDEITWLSNEELSDAYKIAVENMLVAEHKFLTNRTKLSPVKINRNNGYMARSSAMKGITEFSMEDVLVGYVKIDNKFYLYSYCPKYARPNVDSLEAIIAKQNKTMPNMSIVTKVTAVVIDMYKEYKALIDATKKEAERVAEENAKSFNEKQEARKAQREDDEALIAAAGLLDKVKKDKKKVVSTASFSSSSMLDDIEAELF